MIFQIHPFYIFFFLHIFSHFFAPLSLPTLLQLFVQQRGNLIYQQVLSAPPIANSKKILHRNKCIALFKDMYPTGDLEMIQWKGMARSPLAPLYQNCHCWNPYPDNISPIVQLSKRGFVSINQSLGGCQIKYRQTRVKELEIVQIYISLTFPVISPLLGRVPHRATIFTIPPAIEWKIFFI